MAKTASSHAHLCIILNIPNRYHSPVAAVGHDVKTKKSRRAASVAAVRRISQVFTRLVKKGVIVFS